MTSTPTIIVSRPRNLSTVGTRPNVAGLEIQETGEGALRQTVITLNNTPVLTTDIGGTGGFGTVQIYDWPVGVIQCHAAHIDVRATKVGAGIGSTFAGNVSLGTSSATGVSPFPVAEQNLVASTAYTAAVASVATLRASSFSAITRLTDNSGGTAATTIAAIGASYSQTEVRNAIASLAAQVNRLIDNTQGTRIITRNGQTTAADAFLNIFINDADSTANDSLLLNGTIVLSWSNVGNNS